MGWSSIEIFGTQLIGFFVSTVLARLLLPEEFGLIAMIAVFIGIGNVLINSGLSLSLIRSKNIDEEDFSTVFYFNLFVSILIYLIIFLLAPLISDFFNQSVLCVLIRVYGVTFIIDSFSTIQLTRLTIKLDFKSQMLVALPSLIIGSLFGIAMAYSGFGVWSLVWMAVLKSLILVASIYYKTKWIPLRVFNIKKLKHHYNYGIKLMFSGILDIMFTNIYSIIIGKFFLPAQVGYYSRARSFQMFPVNGISSMVSKITLPIFSKIQDDNVRLRNAYSKIMQMIIFIIAPILFFMSFLAEPLFRFLFTDKWLPAVIYFQILCINGILYPINSYNVQILNVKGRSDLVLKLEVIKKLMFVLIIVISLPYGIKALLYGSVFGSVICFFINTHYSGKFIDYSAWKQFKELIPIVLLSFFSGVLVYLLDFYLIGYGDLFRLVVGSLMGSLIYIASSYLFRIKSLFELLKIKEI